MGPPSLWEWRIITQLCSWCYSSSCLLLGPSILLLPPLQPLRHCPATSGGSHVDLQLMVRGRCHSILKKTFQTKRVHPHYFQNKWKNIKRHGNTTLYLLILMLSITMKRCLQRLRVQPFQKCLFTVACNSFTPNAKSSTSIISLLTTITRYFF